MCLGEGERERYGCVPEIAHLGKEESGEKCGLAQERESPHSDSFVLMVFI